MVGNSQLLRFLMTTMRRRRREWGGCCLLCRVGAGVEE
jgi:hypothetical protein